MIKQSALILFSLLLAGLFVVCDKYPNAKTTGSGLRYEHKTEGSGVQAKAGDMVAVHYKGMLEDGKVFDTSHKRRRPFIFKLGARQVIKGWDEGVALMKVGGKTTLIIPPELGYGDRGAGGKIPGGSTLLFDIELGAVLNFPQKPEAGKIKIPATGKQTSPTGLVYYDVVEGKGPQPKKGQTVIMHYVGQLTNGEEFDASWNKNRPFPFVLGQGMVIKGWDEGVAGMKEGGRRILVIPGKLGYGKKGAGGKIGPNATLVFLVDLVGIFQKN